MHSGFHLRKHKQLSVHVVSLKLNDQFEDDLNLCNGDGAYNLLAYLLADNNGVSF